MAKPSVQPTYSAFGRAIGGISTPGDLFYIDTTHDANDIVTTLYITNGQELIHHYRYLIFKVGAYVENGAGEWEKASTVNGELVPDTFITMRGGRVNFVLPGYAKYKITIDSGAFYCTNAGTNGDGLSPQFYLTVN